MLRRLFLAGLAAAAGLGAGCHHCRSCGRDGSPRDRGPYLGDPVPPRGERIPSPDVPTTPGVFPPPVIPDSRSSYRYDPNVGPSPGSWVGPTRDPLLQAPIAPKSGSESLFADPAPRGAPPVIDVPGDRKPARGYLEDPVAPSKGETAPRQSERIDQPATPMPATIPGLPGYMLVPGRSGVAAGGRPSLDGFDALKSNGFRSIVYLHAPGSDIAPARDLAQQRGLKFVPIAVSPATLKPAFDEFAAALSTKPVYVADEDGTRAGGLWYLLFRTQDLLGDDAARLRARSLGLSDASSEEQKQFWVAIQDYLAARK